VQLLLQDLPVVIIIVLQVSHHFNLINKDMYVQDIKISLPPSRPVSQLCT